jgi:hypothetical protein
MRKIGASVRIDNAATALSRRESEERIYGAGGFETGRSSNSLVASSFLFLLFLEIID